jgi:hypothetical protein
MWYYFDEFDRYDLESRKDLALEKHQAVISRAASERRCFGCGCRRDMMLKLFPFRLPGGNVRGKPRVCLKRHRKSDPHIQGCFAEALEAVFEPESRLPVCYTEYMLQELQEEIRPNGALCVGADDEEESEGAGKRRYGDLTHFIQAQFTRASLEAFSRVNTGKSYREAGIENPSRGMVFGRMAELFAEPVLSSGRSLAAALEGLGLRLHWGITAQSLVLESADPLAEDEALEFRIGPHWECCGFQPVGTLLEISPDVLANSRGKVKANGHVIPPPYLFAALVMPTDEANRVIQLFRIPVIFTNRSIFPVESAAERGPIQVLSDAGVAMLKLHVQGDLRALGRELWPYPTDAQGRIPSRPDIIAYFGGKIRIAYVTDSDDPAYHASVDKSIFAMEQFLGASENPLRKVPADLFTADSWSRLLE